MVYSDVSFSQNSRSGVKRFVIGSAFLAAAGLACGAPAAELSLNLGDGRGQAAAA